MEQDILFRNDLTRLVKSLTIVKKAREIISLDTIFSYFILEMPILLNSPSLFGVNSSLFVYHETTVLKEHIYKRLALQEKNQSFLAITFEPTLTDATHI